MQPPHDSTSCNSLSLGRVGRQMLGCVFMKELGHLWPEGHERRHVLGLDRLICPLRGPSGRGNGGCQPALAVEFQDCGRAKASNPIARSTRSRARFCAAHPTSASPPITSQSCVNSRKAAPRDGLSYKLCGDRRRDQKLIRTPLMKSCCPSSPVTLLFPTTVTSASKFL
jgi:hypothetical protein